MSEGRRSGVNCMRLNVLVMASARAWASEVLPIPGGPSMRACPLARSATRRSVAGSWEPRMVWVRWALRAFSLVLGILGNFSDLILNESRRLVRGNEF